MKKVHLYRGEPPALVAEAHVASSLWARFWGLMGKAGLAEGEALLIEPCYSVHTMFMRFAIDVVYLDREHRILKISEHLRPFRTSACRGARSVIEMPAGAAPAAGLAVGEVLRIQAGD